MSESKTPASAFLSRPRLRSRSIASSVSKRPAQTPFVALMLLDHGGREFYFCGRDASGLTVCVSPATISPGNAATFRIFASTTNPNQVVAIHYSMTGTARLRTDYSVDGPPTEVDIPARASSTTVVLHATPICQLGKARK